MNQSAKPVEHTCFDACGAKITTPPDESPPGWQWLVFGRGWRCPDCQRRLQEINERFAERKTMS